MNATNTKTVDGVEYAECRTWAGYWISKDGLSIMSPRGKLHKQRKNNLGYMKVAGVLGADGKHSRSVHRMVMDAWVGVCPESFEVDHKDHVKDNNNVENLQYITHQQNCQRARDAGRFPDTHGCRSPMWGKHPSEKTRELMRQAKLGAKHWRAVKPDVAKIRELRAQGKTDKVIAEELGLKRTTVGEVLRGTHWSVR